MRNTIFFICSIFLLSSCSFDGYKNESVDICRCLNESGSSDWFKKHKQLCNKLISEKIGVKDWKNVNFSKESEFSDKWDEMKRDCIEKMLDNSVFKEQVVDFATAEEFIKQRCININQKYINGKISKHEDFERQGQKLQRSIQGKDYRNVIKGQAEITNFISLNCLFAYSIIALLIIQSSSN